MERTIVTGVDRSARSRVAADWAAHEALSRGLALRVIHVTPPADLDAAQLWPYRPKVVAAHARDELVARYPDLSVECVRLAGTAASVLSSQSGDAEMLVLGVRGEGGHAGLCLGSTALAAAGAAACPVVLVPSGFACVGPPRRSHKVTLAVDARHPADGAIDFAFDIARLRGARLHALHAGAPPPPGCASRSPSAPRYAARADGEMALLSEALRPWRVKYPNVRVVEDVILSGPARALIRTSGSVELMVLGRASAGGLGSVAYDVAQHSRCPVAVVPA
ncbi:universal stress protein [Streptomyces sp. NPDC046909]|uniref:universal stress protein n=1 Tax=Streptomyces sp. NPDC046909 TaxID=3155617 RepID=UPI0033DE62C9